jgi:hypothetical protein
MKKLLIVIFLILFVSLFYLYKTYSFKEKAVSTLKSDLSKLTTYTQWGYDVKTFKDMYLALIQEVKTTSYTLIPFKMNSFELKHDNILRLAQAGYATEVSRQKSEVQTRLSYLRDRVKNSDYIQQSRKSYYFDSFEVVAGNIFEKNSDLNDIRKFIAILQSKDTEITNEIQTIRKESVFNELQGYRLICVELLNYFIEKNSPINQDIAQKCINEADKLSEAGYIKNGVDFIETLSRERVFTASQKASQAKQQLILDEQYALLAKQREIERLTIVPPAPRQEGKIVVVNIGLQRLYAYENGATLFSTAVPITTGKQGFETVLGEFAIYLKEEHHQMQSPFPGIYYDDIVDYWMPFYLGYGLHDAPWRSVYGTQDYTWVGSHGCINIPLKEASILYNWAQIGTRVFVL